MNNYNKEMLEEIMERLKNLETRVSALEKSLASTKEESPKLEKFEGLSGGINKLIHEGFFNTPRSLKEVVNELQRQCYFYAKPAINTALMRDFVKRKNVLTRIGKRGEWKYVLRK